MLNEDRQQELDRLLDGDLSDVERARALEGLESDPEAIDWLADRAWMNAQLQRAIKRRGIEARARSSEETTGAVDLPIRPGGWGVAGLAIAAIAATLVVGVFVWLSGRPSVSVPGIARVIRVDGEVMVNGKRILAHGDELFAADKLSMTNGLVELAFRESGVHVLASAPLSMRLDDPMRLFLHEGEAKLVVPPQGVGFVVETVEQKITDLGTSFVVTARKQGSKVLVLDGEVMVGPQTRGDSQMMFEGDVAEFDRGELLRLRSQQHSGVPELSLPPAGQEPALSGLLLAFDEQTRFPGRVRDEDVIGREVLPLIKSGFRDRSSLARLQQGGPLSFHGIAGSYVNFPGRNGLKSYSVAGGWLAWYQGRVKPPRPGRYRFWGYADNQLLVAVDGRPVFEGSRDNSAFRRELDVPRRDHPALPCLNAVAGFASGPWIEVGAEPVRFDILFGETARNQTSGLLLVEREGDSYEETFWGQPKWPLFLTDPPSSAEVAELETLRSHMEKKLMGSFSIPSESVWRVPVEL
tara:strand:+ start:1496 stop:3064 length:1569 start_codon:yes stop_codon:yes gene_type:complete